MNNEGCIHVSYQELSRTSSGLAQWEYYMEQITSIALQYPNHFIDRIAKEGIPQDARSHQFYAYFLPEKKVAAFCVVVTTHYEAEILWMATHRDHRRKGYASKLVHFIEKELFSPKSSIMMITGKPATPDASLKDTQIGGDKWFETIQFYKQLGYIFLYKLNDYWETNDHAAIFIKRRNQGLYGYSFIDDSSVLPIKPTTLKEDVHPNENATIQEDMRRYIHALYRDFVKKQDVLHESIKSINELDGFIGVVFVPHGSDFVTIFTNATHINIDDYDPEFKFKFEYEIDASLLTRILVSENISDTGVVFYPVRYDEQSEIKIHEAFKSFLPSCVSSDGYSLFYHKFLTENNSMCILYFVTPVLQNVVIEKRNWKAFKDYSFAFFLGIADVLRRALASNLFRNNQYLQQLLNCIPFPSELDQIEVQLIQNQIAQYVLEKERDIVKMQESAIVHFGHSLSHRASNIIDFFNSYTITHDDWLGYVAKNANLLIHDLTILLQAANIHGFNQLIVHEKRNKFLHEAVSEESYNISKIVEKCKTIASKPYTQEVKGIQTKYFVNLRIISDDLQNLSINSFPYRDKYFILEQSLLTPIIAELFDNISSHGEIDKEVIGEEKYKHKQVTKRVWISAENVFGEIALGISNLVINPLNKKRLLFNKFINGELSEGYLEYTENWKPWPQETIHSGPGLAVNIVRQIDTGNLFYRMLPIQTQGIDGFWFNTAFVIKGLTYKENENG